MNNKEFKLSVEQKRFFSTFGFLRLPGLFADDIQDIISGFHRVFNQNPDDIVNWVHETHDNNTRKFIGNFVERDAYLAQLPNDYRIKSIAGDLIGDEVMLRGTDGNFFECGTRWHNDSYGADLTKTNIKFGFYLDKIDGQSGALRFLPGTQYIHETYAGAIRRGLRNPKELFGIGDDEIPAVVYPNVPGDVLVWDYKIMHATCYAGNTRRMIAMDFSEPY